MTWPVVALSALVVCLVLLVVARMYFVLLHHLYHEVDASDEMHFVTTEDGARLALYRYRPRGEVTRQEPVFFCHGLGASKYNFDFDDTYSWARRFAEAGFDVWIVDLRGAGLSTSPKRWNWCFDDYARYDVPAAIAHIRLRTGAEQVHWVGHSMGGMLLYAYLGVGGGKDVRSGVALGSPVRFSTTQGYEHGLRASWLLRYIPYVPIRTAIHLMIPLLPFLGRSSVLRSQLNPENTDLVYIRKVAYNAVHHLPPALLRQFTDWVRHDCFRSCDKETDYQAALTTVDTPVFILSGAGDQLVRPENAKYAYDLMPTAYSRYVEVGRASGFGHDYGHIDLVFGRDADREVLPLVLEWTITHDDTVSPATEPALSLV